ncbi:MAG: cytochrome b/b6 domain-containing protein [Paracoccaceae bacterium]
MPAQNTATTYGSVARTFHWLTALLILANLPLGVIANDMAYDTAEAAALKTQLFSYHKTLGVAIFAVALARILWALSGLRPVPLHPERRAETFVADLVHWALYLSLVVVPLSGWIEHAASVGYAPILWPLGQDLPLVPKSVPLSLAAAAVHVVFTKVLIGAIALHVLGALKHAVVDRDLTMARMTVGSAAGKPHLRHSPAPALAALAIFALGALGAWQIASHEIADEAARQAAPAPAAGMAPEAVPAAGGLWQVAEGRLDFTVQQMGASVGGSLPGWTAEIVFDEASGTGTVSVVIDTAAVVLGSVTDQARGPEFFDTARFATARFAADIVPVAGGFEARGSLTLRGEARPVTLPFTLTIEGDRAVMQGSTVLDRRDFGMGASYGDEKTVGFAVQVEVSLTAERPE